MKTITKVYDVYTIEEHGSVDLIEVSELEEAQALEWLQDRTQVITWDEQYFDKTVKGIIIQQF